MNLRSLKKFVAGMNHHAPAARGIFRQISRRGVLSPTPMKSFASVRAVFFAACMGLASFSGFSVLAQTNYYNPNGTEYAVIGALPGDQVFPDVAISTTGGFLVWQDNITDGDSWGVSARRLDSTLSGTLGPFRVNAIGAGSQENAHVALLKNGGAVFVWQGGKPSYQHIFARFLSATNTFLTTNDVQVNTFSANFQINPAVAVLNNSNVVVVWASFNQFSSNSMQDVYGQILSPTGQKVGGEFLVNQTTSFNQRSPAVAALPGGGFVVSWVSEQQRAAAPLLATNSVYVTAANAPAPSVDIYTRIFNNSGTATGSETLVNTGNSPCASPSVAAATDGSYLVAWTAADRMVLSNSFDVFGRTFTSSGAATSVVFRINNFQYGDQYVPHISPLGLDFLVTWTSLAQDGSREGVFARYVHNSGSLTGNEFRVNTTTAGQQMHPAVGSDGANQFLVVWTSFTGLPNEFDLYAQRYINVSAYLQAMPAPYVWAPFVVSNGVYQPRLVITWGNLLGLSVSNFEVYVDGVSVPTAVVNSNQWTMTAANGLTVNSTHSFQADYVTTDGRRSPLSPSASGTTWQGYSWGGIPFEWMTGIYGSDLSQWPSATKVLGGRLTVYGAFLSGSNPLDPTTWLKQQIVRTQQGYFLTWNTQPGATYQVQVSTNLTTFINLGSPRFAAGNSDSIYVGGNASGFYQIVLMR